MKRYWALGRLIPIRLEECETVCAYAADDLFRGFAPETDGKVWEAVCRSRIRVLRLNAAIRKERNLCRLNINTHHHCLISTVPICSIPIRL